MPIDDACVPPVPPADAFLEVLDQYSKDRRLKLVDLCGDDLGFASMLIAWTAERWMKDKDDVTAEKVLQALISKKVPKQGLIELPFNLQRDAAALKTLIDQHSAFVRYIKSHTDYEAGFVDGMSTSDSFLADDEAELSGAEEPKLRSPSVTDGATALLSLCSQYTDPVSADELPGSTFFLPIGAGSPDPLGLETMLNEANTQPAGDTNREYNKMLSTIEAQKKKRQRSGGESPSAEDLGSPTKRLKNIDVEEVDDAPDFIDSLTKPVELVPEPPTLNDNVREALHSVGV